MMSFLGAVPDTSHQNNTENLLDLNGLTAPTDFENTFRYKDTNMYRSHQKKQTCIYTYYFISEYVQSTSQSTSTLLFIHTCDGMTCQCDPLMCVHPMCLQHTLRQTHRPTRVILNTWVRP